MIFLGVTCLVFFVTVSRHGRMEFKSLSHFVRMLMMRNVSSITPYLKLQVDYEPTLVKLFGQPHPWLMDFRTISRILKGQWLSSYTIPTLWYPALNQKLCRIPHSQKP